MPKELKGTYGSMKTPCTIFTYKGWYCVEGSKNVNYTPDSDMLIDGVDVETIPDTDTMTASEPVETKEQLEYLVDND